MRSMSCSDVGLWTCDFIIKGKTEDDIMINAEEHLVKAHGMKLCKFCQCLLDEKGLCHGCDRQPELCTCPDDLLYKEKIKSLIKTT